MGYYFISVGGSGARVLESLTHLCVAGLLPNKERQGHLYAMSIDPDTANGNLKRTERLLGCLDDFQGIKVGGRTPLLKTPLRLSKPFVWSPAKLGWNLDDTIFYHNSKGKPIGRLYESLYTAMERTTVLDEGFRGRPSIGAAVMGLKAAADVAGDTAWGNLVSAVQSDVKTGGQARIFLAGSVFGGTGAAGLPTVARLLRERFSKQCDEGKVRIGGALMLPYFAFAPNAAQKKSSGLFASSDNFLTNTKAALRYYADTGGSGYDSMYFVGADADNMTHIENFSVGAASQRNNAHIAELFAAMAALHFYRGVRGQHCYCISRNQDDAFEWADLPDVEMEDGTRVSVHDRLVQFVRFIFAYLHIIKPVWPKLVAGEEDAHNYPWYKDFCQGLDMGTPEVGGFEQYAEGFALWLDQALRSAGARSVDLIKLIHPNSFSIHEGRAEINPDMFGTLDYGSSQMSIKKVRDRLAKGKGGGFFGTLLGGRKGTDGTEQGFGLLLRRLYDSCEVKK